MLGAPPAQDEEQSRLIAARAEFVASLPRRIDALRARLTLLEEDPSDGRRQQGLLRRVHALASAARVLGFASVAEVLSETERTVSRTSRPGSPLLAFQDISRALDLLPSLVLGAGTAARRVGVEAEVHALERAYPISVLLFGAALLADALKSEEPERLSIEHTEDAERAHERARALSPDVLVLDADRPETSALVEALLADPQIEPAPFLVIGSFVRPESAMAYVKRGAERVLPKPVSPEMLCRAVLELHELGSRPKGVCEPLGELTVDALADRLAEEIHKGLVESVEPGGHSTPVELGAGVDVLAALWGALARVRELVTVRSEGSVRFQPFGPEGAIPFAPFDERRSGERSVQRARNSEEVALAGRRILVVDDDPAVVWFMGGLFKAVGAEVIEAHDGRRALDLAFRNSPDVVVSDILMPGYDGFTLCHELKRDVSTRDIPVILLSWKEDLLQRVRELGADADGYLRKEATASTVVARVREVLRPRARVERRLAAGGEIQGRLDGLTSRFVLERVCAALPDAALTVRDAVYLYEVQVRGGRVVSATRTAADGSFDRGESVIAGLLGVSAGRFSVKPDSSPCRLDFQDPLEALLERHVRRARSALEALSSDRLARVTRIEIDRASVGAYAACCPVATKTLLERLMNGASPRELLLEDSVAPRLLESLLSDLSRRGAVRSVDHEAFTPTSRREPILPTPPGVASPDPLAEVESGVLSRSPEPASVAAWFDFEEQTKDAAVPPDAAPTEAAAATDAPAPTDDMPTSAPITTTSFVPPTPPTLAQSALTDANPAEGESLEGVVIDPVPDAAGTSAEGEGLPGVVVAPDAASTSGEGESLRAVVVDQVPDVASAPVETEVSEPRPELASTLVSRTSDADAAEVASKAQPSSRDEEGTRESGLRTGVLAVIAFILAYLLVRFLLVPTLEPEKEPLGADAHGESSESP